MIKMSKIVAGFSAIVFAVSAVVLTPAAFGKEIGDVGIVASAAASAEDFINSAYNTSNVTIYDGSSKYENFNMNGRTYYEGVVCGGNSLAQFNVENVNSLLFTIGHVDGSAMDNSSLTVYVDDVVEDKIELTPTMNLMDYTLDVSNASVVKFRFDKGSRVQYAIADISVDGKKPVRKNEVPIYYSAGSFATSAFNTSYATIYDSSSEFKNFNMNGRTYYDGVVFRCKISPRVQFNVENVNSLSFTIGHVDGSRMRDSSLTIYLDNVAKDEIELTSDMDLMNYTLDVSNASVVEFRFTMNYLLDEPQYAIADISIDGKKPVFKNKVPIYYSAESFVTSAFNTSNATIYDSSSKSKNFNMNGRTYYEGVVFSGKTSSRAQFNVENVNSLSFTIGHVDGSQMYDSSLTVYVDNIAKDEIELTPTMNLMNYSLDVSSASVVKLIITNAQSKNTPQYAIGDISIDGETPVMKNKVPIYDSSESFVKSAFNTSNVTIYNVSSNSKSKTFNMGKIYYEGVVFTCVSSPCVQFNVENVDSLSFTIGHVDGSHFYDTSLTIYLDNVAKDEIELTSTMNLINYSLDVSSASVVEFRITKTVLKNKPQYAIADISIGSSSTPGDVNGDGETNVKDVIRMQKSINDGSASSAFDVNGDKEVNIKDVIRLQKFLNGDPVKIV